MLDSSYRPTRTFCGTTIEMLLSRRPRSSSATDGIQPRKAQLVISSPNVSKHVSIQHENGPRRSLRGPFLLVAGTGFEPATSGL
jgi:hypothetical protein